MTISTHEGHDHRAFLKQIARKAMTEYGLLPDFSPSAISQAQQAQPANAQGPVAGGTTAASAAPRDLRQRLWCSIDNDDSMDLDQLTVSARQCLRHQRLAVLLNLSPCEQRQARERRRIDVAGRVDSSSA